MVKLIRVCKAGSVSEIYFINIITAKTTKLIKLLQSIFKFNVSIFACLRICTYQYFELISILISCLKLNLKINEKGNLKIPTCCK